MFTARTIVTVWRETIMCYNNIPLSGSVPLKAQAGKVKDSFFSKSVPGWKDHVKPFKENAKFWHSIWLSAGRPNTGVLHDIMSNTRNKYHYMIRKVKKMSNNIRAQNLMEASQSGDINFLKEMKKINGGKKGVVNLPEYVEDAVGQDEIVEKFKEVYDALYNSAESFEAVKNLKEQIRGMIGPSSLNVINKVNGEIVKKAVLKMKAGKADISGSYSSDALLNSPDIVFETIAEIFRSFLVHGTASRHLLVCAFLPLLKSSLKRSLDRKSFEILQHPHGSTLHVETYKQRLSRRAPIILSLIHI